MARTSRENTIEEKRRMRNNRNKRKIILRAEKKRKAADILRQKERAEYSHAKELARFYYGKSKDLARQNKSRALDNCKASCFAQLSAKKIRNLATSTRTVSPTVDIMILFCFFFTNEEAQAVYYTDITRRTFETTREM